MKKYPEIALTSAALFWGASGVLTQVALTDMSPMVLIAGRFLVASLLGVFMFKRNIRKVDKSIFRHASVLSFLLLIIYVSSTIGLKYTSASNAGFIIGSSVILVPVINVLVFRSKLSSKELVSSVICFIGLGLVTLKGTMGINIGDFYCFIDAVAYSLFIIYSSRLKADVDVKALITIQYTMVFLMTGLYVVLFESVSFKVSVDSLTSVILLGAVCTFLAFLFQISAQKKLNAERTSRILALIPIFTVFFDVVYFGVSLTVEALIGGLMIVTATVLIDLNFKRKPKLSNFNN